MFANTQQSFLSAAASLLAAALCLVLFPASLMAQQNAFQSSYITPFPQGDTYNVRVVGDSLAEGVVYGLKTALQSEGRISVSTQVYSFTRITANSFRKNLSKLKRNLAGAQTHIAVIMLGTQDRRRIRTPNGRRQWIGTPEWRTEFARRVDRTMKVLKSAGIALYWVGLPNMRSRDADAGAQIINEILRERAYLNNVKFIDIYSSFAGEGGGYSAFGPDLAGNVKRLRWRDGIHFTGQGYAKLSHYVAREVRRDLARAKSERSIPLAGSESEQQIVSQLAKKNEDPKDEKALKGWKASIDEAKQKVATRQEPTSFFMNATGGEQKAAHGRINLKALGANGREQIVSLEILRPAIPASVMALVTRKQSRSRASQIGDTLLDETVNGVNIMSTVTSVSDASISGRRRKLSLAQTPFFRVLVKGERLQSRPGRADDFSWPRPELPQFERPKPVLQKPLYEPEDEGGMPLPTASPFRPRA
ncbi:MAG: DUF459 domain-containing protein [Alphaproteobacteria bacterium]|nr:DUF459 domain-containing protein [Alphaproteobacteria bacterium]